MAQLVRAPACKARDPASNPGPGENFSLKLTPEDLSEGYSEKLNLYHHIVNVLVRSRLNFILIIKRGAFRPVISLQPRLNLSYGYFRRQSGNKTH